MLLAYIYTDVDKTFFLFMFTVLIQIENFQRKENSRDGREKCFILLSVLAEQ